MGTQSSYVEDRLRSSYWFLPAVMLVGSAVLAAVMVAIDDHTDIENVRWLRTVIYSGSPDGAREVLGTIAASMITVAGVVFSITIVSLQLASSQFGPRMLANFMRDRGNQITLGTFVSAFLYSLLVLRAIRTDRPGDVPHVSTTVAVLLAVAGLSVLIYFIHHISTAIQAPNLVDAIAQELTLGVEHLFPDLDRVPNAVDGTDDRPLPQGFDENARRIDANSTGFVEVIDVETLVQVARQHDLVVKLVVRAGRFVVDNTPFAYAYPADRVTDEVEEELAQTVITGARRTAVQDIEFPIKQMTEIAVRALSPAINDPFTANTCVDQASAGLCALAGREFPSTRILDATGHLRVVAGDPVTFGRVVGAAYDQIRQAASFHAPVYVHLLEALSRVAGCVVDPARLQPLVNEGELVLEAARRNVEAEADLRTIEKRYVGLQAAVRQARENAARQGAAD
ncbi:MAG TPA: DUF2254 domain-containing protein [Nocardioidaceae bacterium]|nr:DUF2254 domain-containing protein [Nocardioidaceae bacterium]